MCILLLLIKVPFVLFLFAGYAITEILKYALVFPAAVRAFERGSNFLLFHILLQAFATQNSREHFHKLHADFSFLKDASGEQTVNRRKYIKSAEPTVILSNHASLIDWLFLMKHFSPVFTQVDLRPDGQMAIRPLSGIETAQTAIGIRFPSQKLNAKLYHSFKELRDSLWVKSRPIVVFPQCARTNGKGVLNVPPQVCKMIEGALQDGFKVHSIRFDYDFAYFSPYNSTSTGGKAHALGQLS